MTHAAKPAAIQDGAPVAGPQWIPIVVLIVCAMLWSLNGPLIKILQLERDGAPGVTGATMACYRSLIGGIVFLPWALRGVRTVRRVHIGWPIGSVVIFTIMTITFVVATTRTAAANAIVLQYTSPLWVFMLSPLLLKEKPRLDEGLVLLVAMAGVFTIFAGNPSGELLWLGVALISGWGYGTLTVVLRGLRPVSPFTVAGMNALGSGLLLIPAVALWGQFNMTGEQWGLVFALALFQFTLPYVLFSWALQRIEAHKAALITLLETVLNPIFTWLLVREAVPPATLLGGPLIILGVVGWLLITWRRAAAKRIELPPPDAPEAL